MPRAIQAAILSMGMVNIPVKLFTAAQSKSVSFHLLDKESGRRLRQQLYADPEPAATEPLDERQVAVKTPLPAARQGAPNPKSTAAADDLFVPSHEHPVSRENVVKGYELNRDEYVSFTPAELKALEEAANQHAEIQEFVALDSIDPVYFEKSYYLGPDQGGDKAYRLLARALADERRGAVAKLVMRGKEKLVLIRPTDKNRLILHVLYYADEVRNFDDIAVPDVPLGNEELRLATQLIALRAAKTWNPEQYHDTYRERILALIDQKQQGKAIAVGSVPRKAEVLDLMDALKRSLATTATKSAKMAIPTSQKSARRLRAR